MSNFIVSSGQTSSGLTVSSGESPIVNAGLFQRRSSRRRSLTAPAPAPYRFGQNTAPRAGKGRSA
jgi:hypothetical protein